MSVLLAIFITAAPGDHKQCKRGVPIQVESDLALKHGNKTFATQTDKKTVPCAIEGQFSF